MSHKMLRPFIVKVSVLGYFHRLILLHCTYKNIVIYIYIYIYIYS